MYAVCKNLKKKGRCEVVLWRPHKLSLFSPLLTPLFHEHLHWVFGVLLYAISESCDTDFVSQVVHKPWSFVSVLWGAHANYSYFDICSRLRASAASACNCASYRTFNVMVLKMHTLYYTHYIKWFTNWVYCSVPARIRTKFVSQAGWQKFGKNCSFYSTGSIPKITFIFLFCGTYEFVD